MKSAAHRVQSNLARVRERMQAAAIRCGRDPHDVRLTAVTKYVGPDVIRALHEAGCGDFAESRPQQLWQKAQLLQDLEVKWHLIGHLQRNKVARTLPLISLMQSVDSLRLLQAVQDWARSQNRELPLLVEVNVSGDQSKHGFPPDELESAIQLAMKCDLTPPLGLMCMAGREGGHEAARSHFIRLRDLRDTMRGRFPNGPPLDELSMGMSRDFEIAIEEGATIVRVGSILYEGLTID